MLQEINVRDSASHLEAFIAEMRRMLKRRLDLINSNPDPNSEPFYIYREPEKSFIRFVVRSHTLRNALRKEEHSEDEKNYILFAGDAQQLIQEALTKNQLSLDDYNYLIKRFGFSDIEQARLIAIFKKYDTVYKEPYNGLTFFQKAAIATLGTATVLASYALATRE